jgi:hypothetical protein
VAKQNTVKTKIITKEEAYFAYFKTLLKPVEKGKPFAYVMRVERDYDNQLAYVCCDAHRMHILRTVKDFEFFEPGNEYRFTVTSKSITFEKLEEHFFPNWRRVIPDNLPCAATACITKQLRSQYLAGLYCAGIFIVANYLADLEPLNAEYKIYADKDMRENVVFKASFLSCSFDFVAVPFIKLDEFVVLKSTDMSA